MVEKTSLLIQIHSENHRCVCQTDAPLPKDAVSLGHLFTSLDLLTKATYSDEGFPHPACVSLNRLRNYTKIWKARMLAQHRIKSSHACLAMYVQTNVGVLCVYRLWIRGSCGERRGVQTARLLGLWICNPQGTWLFVCCECCMSLGRGLCDKLITCAEESC